MFEMNEPVPDPSVVWGSATVGLAAVLQHTPLADTGELPPFVILPPDIALIPVIPEGEEVVIQTVENATSPPYPVPAAFVAYALT